MCLILFAHRAHPQYPLVVAANRDEFYERPTEQANYWPDAPHLIAGRDLTAGGTWLGITTGGRFSAITNVRQPGALIADAHSRGELTRDFLIGNKTLDHYADEVLSNGDYYNGFNLLLGDGKRMLYISNRADSNHADQALELTPGIYGLSNHLLDTAWPKVEQGKQSLRDLLSGPLESQHLLEFLANPSIAQDHELPKTGISLQQERMLSAAFIRGENYGTRCSTAIIVDTDQSVTFHERSFYPQQPIKNDSDVIYQFTLKNNSPT